MTTKTYKSNSCIAINVVLPNKTNLHIAFTPQTLQGSSFTTSNKDIQDAIEKHHGFKRLFRLEKVVQTKEEKIDDKRKDNKDIETDPKDAEKKTKTDDKGTKSETELIADDDDLEKVEVSDLTSAREYLNSKFGIEKKSLMSKASILEAAKTYKIEFVGL